MSSIQIKQYFKLGLVVNPMAGWGGAAGLKGSDDPKTYELAVARGVLSKLSERVSYVIAELSQRLGQLNVVTAGGVMGANICEPYDQDISLDVVYPLTGPKTTSQDTIAACEKIVETGVDLILFVGGDGTARDVFMAVGESQAVLGLPAGVKMHSGVFAVTPKAVVSVIDSMVNHRLVAARLAEVRDIDESDFAKGIVSTRYYGEMLIPDDQMLVQAVKCSGILDDELMLEELSAYMLEELDEQTLYILGSGGTLRAIKSTIGISDPTLLGVDVWFDGELIVKDAYETQLFDLIQQYPTVKIVLSVIGGQGIVLGRGNQQISARIIEQVGVNNLQFVSTQNKILALEGRPLRVDSGSDDLDRRLSGFHKIMCGYDDAILYEISYAQ
jgi:predicted polyphosphate/ATP-dependent NAD kinase